MGFTLPVKLKTKADENRHKHNFLKNEINKACKEDLAYLSFYKIQNNFGDSSFGSTDKYGIYGSTPP